MTKQQIKILLNKAEKMEFFDLIEFLTGEEKEYGKSEFYKKTRIPLLQLFKEYYEFNRSREGIIVKLLKNLSTFEDYNLLTEKIEDLSDYISKNSEATIAIENLFRKFINMEELQDLAKILKEETDKLKK